MIMFDKGNFDTMLNYAFLKIQAQYALKFHAEVYFSLYL